MSVIDISGQRFGMITALSVSGTSPQGQAMWLCACDCGVRKSIRGDHLRSGRVVSCGCHRSSGLDLVGQQFGRLIVIERGPDHRSGSTNLRRWWCLCQCGERSLARGQSLRNGHTRSCGCLSADLKRERGGRVAWSLEAGYGAAHNRVRKERGAAMEHDCVDCGRQAAEWSYRGGCPNEQVQWRTTGWAPEGRPIPYSLDPDFYDPRCRSCHRAFDRKSTRRGVQVWEASA